MEDAGDTPLYLENVKGSILPCITNICSSRDLVALALECEPSEIMSKISGAINKLSKPKTIQASGYKEIEASLDKLPILTHQTTDGGAYIASA
ncbi:uncharacterized protein METZ01_LOCUS151433, partial [marine metagenome]